MNKKLLKSIVCIASSIGVASSIPFATTSCGSSSDVLPKNVLPYEVYEYDENNVLQGFKEGVDLSKYDGICNTMQIPAKVTSVKESAFITAQLKTKIPSFITKLTFAEGSNCSSIGTRAFYMCGSLTSVNLPSSLISVDSAVFDGCTKLQFVDFFNCTKLEVLSSSSFRSCPLKSIDLSFTKIKSIGNGCFGTCALTPVILPNILETIGDLAFNGNRQLTSIDLSNCVNLSFINQSAFVNDTALTSIKLPGQKLSTIGKNAFQNCSNLSSITWNAWQGNLSLDQTAFSTVKSTGNVTITNLVDGHSSTELLTTLKQNGGLPDGWTAA